MKGFIYQGPGSIELKELELPACGADDIIVKNIYAGICGSDLTAWQHGGDAMRIYPGCEFGHEMVSVVTEVGKNVTDIRKGERVYPYPLFCKGDTSRSSTVGGFSEYVHIPNCRLNHSVYKVDDCISDKAAAMLEPFSVGGQAAILSRPVPGQNAVVFGAGVIGMAAAITLKHLGCEKVLLVNRSTYRLDIAKELGFEVLSPVLQDFGETAMAALGTDRGIMGTAVNADIYIDATGSEDALNTFQKYGKLNAVFTIVGLHHKPLTIAPLPLTYSSWRIQGSGGYTPESVQTALEIMRSGSFALEKLVTQEYPHEQLEEALAKAAVSSESLKVLIKYQ